MIELIIVLCIILAILIRIKEYKDSPYCKFCRTRHYGKCIFQK